MRRFLSGATIAAAFFLGGPAQAIDDLKGLMGPKATPVLVMGSDHRVGLEEFVAAHAEQKDAVQSARAASGLVECGDAHGAGQLTLRDDLVTTAAHVLFDERGAQRARSCDFVAEVNGVWTRTPLDMASIVVGAARPYAVKAVNDWAVVRLTRPVKGAQPYALAPKIGLDDEVQFVARGHSNWRDKRDLSFEACRLRNVTNEAADGRREFAFDCNTGDGASGGGVFVDRRLGAILVGWRSNDPARRSPFSLRHYNFVVAIEGAFREAVLRAADLPAAAPVEIAGSPASGPGGEVRSATNAAQTKTTDVARTSARSSSVAP